MNKKKVFDVIASEVIVCVKCRLSKTRKNAVPGEGNPQSKIMFIGEAPGFWEDIEGKPFVGAAGMLLSSLLSEIGFSRKDVFICNVLKCRPPRNREPSQIEIQTCTPYLDRQIRTVRPKSIVTLGNHPTAYIFSKANIPFAGITQAHGKAYEAFFLGMHVTIFPTFHPAAALHNHEYKNQLVNDFKHLRSELLKKGTVKTST